MAEVTITEISMEDAPVNVVTGTAQRRATAHIRCTSAATTDTLNLATYEPNIADILGFTYQILDGADITSGTASPNADNTWSTSTITFAAHAGSGVWEIGAVVRYT